MRASDVRTRPGADFTGGSLIPIAALLVAQFAVAVVPFGVGPLAPYLREAYDLQRSHVGPASGLIFVAVAAFSLPAGRVTDRVGVPAALVASAVLVGVGGLGAAVATAPAAFAVAMFVIGSVTVAPRSGDVARSELPDHPKRAEDKGVH